MNIIAVGIAFGVGVLFGMAIVYFSGERSTPAECPDCGSPYPAQRYLVPLDGCEIPEMYTPRNSRECFNRFHNARGERSTS